MTLQKKDFGKLPDGTPVELFTLSDGILTLSITPYGARLTSLLAPDRNGALGECVLGHESVTGYVADEKTFMGAIVGRFGNRIAHGRFTLDGTTYEVPLNDGENALHGGTIGFDRKLWTVTEQSDDAVAFTLVSPDGDMGFPGTLTLTVRYSLAEGSLRLDYTATTDRPTVINVTNHAYFNLAGSGTILQHELTIPAEHFTPISEALIPTGELQLVAGTPFDFRSTLEPCHPEQSEGPASRPYPIGERIHADDPQLTRARGYDHNWVFGDPGTLKLTAILHDPASGRCMTVQTTEPGMQFYSGNFLDGTLPARSGEGTVAFRSGLCLETQHYPDSPNQSGFPTTILRPGETMKSVTLFRFSTSAEKAIDA